MEQVKLYKPLGRDFCVFETKDGRLLHRDSTRGNPLFLNKSDGFTDALAYATNSSHIQESDFAVVIEGKGAILVEKFS